MPISPEIIFRTLDESLIRKWVNKRGHTVLNHDIWDSFNKSTSEFSKTLQVDGFLKISQLFTERCVDGLLACRQALEQTEVHVGDSEQITWLEYPFPGDSNVPEIIFDETGLSDDLISSLLGTNVKISKTTSWINCYRPGEFIPRHSDAGGTIQVLIGLMNPGLEAGTRLFVEGEPVSLKRGDLFVFKACELEHWTEPVPENNQTARINTTLRFYLE